MQGVSVRIEDVRRGEIDAQLNSLSDLHRNVGADAGENRLLDSRDAGRKDGLGAERLDLNDLRPRWAAAGLRSLKSSPAGCRR